MLLIKYLHVFRLLLLCDFVSSFPFNTFWLLFYLFCVVGVGMCTPYCMCGGQSYQIEHGVPLLSGQVTSPFTHWTIFLVLWQSFYSSIYWDGLLRVVSILIICNCYHSFILGTFNIYSSKCFRWILHYCLSIEL